MSEDIVIDKAYKGNGFEQGVLYCFNHHLKGLCNKCKAKVDCQKERNILNNMGISRFDVENELEGGVKVKIIAGPFQGMFGTVDSVDLPTQKVNLTVELFGQETSVEVELSQIEKA